MSLVTVFSFIQLFIDLLDFGHRIVAKSSGLLLNLQLLIVFIDPTSVFEFHSKFTENYMHSGFGEIMG